MGLQREKTPIENYQMLMGFKNYLEQEDLDNASIDDLIKITGKNQRSELQ